MRIALYNKYTDEDASNTSERERKKDMELCRIQGMRGESKSSAYEASARAQTTRREQELRR
jgi:hypothetical protein